MRLRLRIGTMLIACASVALVVAAEQRADAKPKLGVLGIEPVDEGDASSVDKTTALAHSLTEGLRAAARRAGSKYDAAPNGNKELGELKLVSDCLDETVECMASIGRDVGADRLMFGHLKKQGKGYTFVVQLLNVGTKANEGKVRTYTVADDASDDDAKKIASTAFGDLTGLAQKGSIVLQANVQNGVVYLDGNTVGAITNGTATIADLDDGTYLVAIESEGYKRFEVDVPLRGGETARVPVQLEKATGDDRPDILPPGGDKPTARPGGTSRALFWTTLVVTTGGIASFTITGIKVKDYEDEKNNAIRMSAGTIMAGSGDDACAEAEAESYEPVTSPCKNGKQMATVTNVLIGATAVMALATGYFYYKGYIAPGPRVKEATSRERAKKKSGTTVVVVPEIYPSGAGLGAVIQF